MYVVQSVLLSRDKFRKHEALDWIHDHGYKADKIDATPDHWRFRQVDPNSLHHGRFRTVKLGNNGYLIVFYSGPEK